MYFEVICKYFSWPFQLNYQTKDRKIYSIRKRKSIQAMLFLHLQIFIFIALTIKLIMIRHSVPNARLFFLLSL